MPVLPGDFHGQRSLAGYSPRGHKESDTTKQLSLSPLHRVFMENKIMHVSIKKRSRHRKSSLNWQDFFPLEEAEAPIL